MSSEETALATTTLEGLPWPGATEDEDGMAYVNFAAEVAQKLMQQDYCVIKTALPEEIVTEAVEESNKVRFKSVKDELKLNYLGRNSSAKVHWMKSVGEGADSALEQCDLYFATLGQLLEPLTLPTMGFESGSRTGSMLRRPFASVEEFYKLTAGAVDDDDVEEGVIEQHIKFQKRRKLCMSHILQSEGATLTLIPKDSAKEQVKLEVGAGSMIVFRHDEMSYQYEAKGPEDLVLQSWLLTYPQGVTPTVFAGDVKARDALIGIHCGPASPSGNTINIMVVEPGLPSNCHDDADAYWCALASGLDGYIRVPESRFNIDPYYIDYRTGNWQLGYSYACHAGFIQEDIYSIDNEFFKCPDEEAQIMSPATKMGLQHGYACMHKGGFRKETMNGAKVCVYAGHSGEDWSTNFIYTAPMAIVEGQECHKKGYGYRGWHNQFSQINYHLGLTGNTVIIDTACSSALVGYTLCHAALRAEESHQMRSSFRNDTIGGLIFGANYIPGEGAFVNLSMPHLLSPTGRCFTFDTSADGFARGEGTGVLYVQPASIVPEDAIGVMIGACANQDGRSASMTAPNGPAQQMCIRGSMQEAGLSANDVTCAECHGTGTALGDPIEVGALKGVMKDRIYPLAETSAKAHFGHLEASAGMAGMMKCIVMCSASAGSPSPHLTCLNSNLDVTGYPTIFCTDLTTYGTNAGISGVSSFGWGGANGRADIWAACRRGLNKVKAFSSVDVSLLNFVTVQCPVDEGPIHFVDGTAMRPEEKEKARAGPHRPSTLRGEFDTYETSSSVFKGTYQLDATAVQEEEDTPETPESVFIIGSWTGFLPQKMQLEEAEEGAEDDRPVYSFSVILGDTRAENFSISLDKAGDSCIYPYVDNGSMNTRLYGPDKLRANQQWLIDGRNARVSAGSVYKVQLRWGNQSSVSWALADAVCSEAELQARRSQQSFCVQGTFTSWGVRPMAHTRQKDGASSFTFSLKLSALGKEQFQFLENGLEKCSIYPQRTLTRKDGSKDVPVCGPDDLGEGRFFFCSGTPGEQVTLKLVADNGKITVEADCQSEGCQVWESKEGLERHDYYVVGSFSDWKPIPLSPDSENGAIYKCRGETSVNAKEYFQIMVDGDATLLMYPEATQTVASNSFVRGPDRKGAENVWEINCWMPGAQFEITLDLDAADKRKKVAVTWVSDQIDLDTMKAIVANSIGEL